MEYHHILVDKTGEMVDCTLLDEKNVKLAEEIYQGDGYNLEDYTIVIEGSK